MKHILLSIAALVMSSCSAGDSESGNTTILESVTITQAGKAPVVWKHVYANTGSTTAVVDGKFTALPQLIQQKIQGAVAGSIETINYSYSPTAITIETITGGVKTKDSIRYDANKMAASLYTNEIPGPYYIKYDPKGFVTQVDDVAMTVTNDNYTRATNLEGDVEIARYEYTDMYNYVGLKQMDIYGSDNFWATGHFGRPSSKLLLHVYRTEEGREVEYTYAYSITYIATGGYVVSQERIFRELTQIYTIRYNYETVTVSI